MGLVMRRRKDRKVGGPKAQKLWRLGEAWMASGIVRERCERKRTDKSQRSCIEDS
jgi:hypothetical protein